MKKNRALLFCALSFALLSSVHAMPSGEALVHGNCTLERGSSSLTINQNSCKAIINWESFSLAEGELVQFVQPDSRSALLNRVISQSPSEIYGQLQANGKLYLINQNGIVVGPTGKIQAASFIASTLHLEDELFLQDKLKFSGNRDGKLLQQGMIAVEGSIFLLAREVVNEGLLSAPNGSVCLASGSEVYLIDSRDGGAVKISGVGSVSNTGGIEAARAELRAAAGNIYALAVNQEGITNATGSMEVGGEIILQAGSGLVSVSGEMSAEQGGKIHLLGDFVHLTNDAALSVSGDAGGGEILVGGDYKGSNPAIPNAKGIYVGPGVHISADALRDGDGGKVIFWGNDATCYYGTTSAQGGPLGGDGGFVEISSHGLLVPEGHVTTVAPKGKTGTLLFDPVLVNISTSMNSGVNGLPPPPMPTEPDPYTVVFNASSANINTTNLQNALGVNNIIINSTGTGTGDGEILILNSLTWSTATTLTLIASAITVQPGVSLRNTFSGSNFTAFDFQANLSSSFSINFHGIHLQGTISTVDGNISLQGNCPGAGSVFTGVYIDATSVSATGLGGITIIGNAGVLQDGVVVSANGSTPSTVTAVNGNISITGTGQEGVIVEGATISSTGMGTITIAGTGNQTNHSVGINIINTLLPTSIMSSSSNITLTGMGSPTSTSDFNVGILLIGSVSSTSGVITINGTGGGTTGSSGANYGISFGNEIGAGSTSINSVNGSIALIGVGGSGSTDNNGIDLTPGFMGTSTIASSGSAPISLNGTAGGNSGIGINASPASITGTSGSISLTGVGAGGGAGLVLPAVGGSTSGPITLQADSMAFNGNVTTTGAILVEPVTPTLSIGVGSGSGALSLSNAALASIRPGTTARIGRANGTHTIFIDNAVFASNFTMQGSVITVGSTGITNANGKTIIFAVGINANGSFNQNGPLTSGFFFANGAAFNDTFTITDSSQTLNINGGGGSNKIIGPTAGSSWAVTGNNAGTLGNDTFSNIGFLQGGTGVDTFTFMGAFQIANGSGSTGINGTSGNDTIVGPGVTTTWAITSSNAGTLTPGAISATAFANIVNLTGGSLNDSFVFSNGAGITGAINGGAGTNTLDYSLYSTAVSVNIATGIATNITGGFTNIQNFIGGMTLTDTLTGPNTANTWMITNVDEGSINSSAFTFTSFENLVGGTMNDSFVFGMAGDVNGTLNGGTGTNTLDYTAYLAPVSVNIGAGTATGTIGISNFQNFIGGSSSLNALAGPNAGNVWNITSNNAGNINFGAFTFSAFASLTGGNMNDIFIFMDGTSIARVLNGGAGVNTLNYGFYTTPVFVDLQTGTTTGADGGFANIRIFEGGSSGDDTFQGMSTVNIWHITGHNSGNIGGTVTFDSFQNLIGGMTMDSFVFSSGASVDGTINGGTGTSTFDYTAYSTNVAVNLGAGTATGTGGFSNVLNFIGGSGTNNQIEGPDASNTWAILAHNGGQINSLAGSFTFTAFQELLGGSLDDIFDFTAGFFVDGLVNGNAGSNTLLGPNGPFQQWHITSNNSGDVGEITFVSIQNLTGGSGNDQFTFGNGVALSGTIDGGGGINTLDYTSYSTLVFANIQTKTATGVDSFTNITDFIGGSGSNTLTGPNLNNTWELILTNSGYLDSFFYKFTNFENLIGGTMNDDFVFDNGATITGSINGGLGSNTFDFTAYMTPVSINIGSGVATGASSFSNIQNFIGGSDNNTLTGPNTNSIWRITSNNVGNINSSAFTFSQFQNLIGNTMNDDYIFSAGAGVSGAIDGGLGNNTFDYAAYTTSVTVNVSSGTATGIVGGFTNIQNFFGSTSASGNTFQGPNTNNLWEIAIVNGASINIHAFTFESFENLIGGSMNDHFAFNEGIGVTGTIDGGSGGTNTLDYAFFSTAADISVDIATGTATSVGGGFSNIQEFIGGSGLNTLTGPNTVNTWTITSANSGDINSNAFIFSAFENLIGGTMNDTFAFDSGASIAGVIDGGAGTNSLNYSAYDAPVSVNTAAETAPGIEGGFTNIQNFIGSGSSSTLTGPNSANTWSITGNNAGNINAGAITFSGFDNLIGSTMNDSFAFMNGAGVTGAINGEGGVNTFDYSAYITAVSVNLEEETATGAGSFSNIQNFIGSSSSTLTGPNTANTWSITGNNTGNINSGAFTFSSFENLTGGTMNDSFVFHNGVGVNGLVDGGAGVNTLNYSAYAMPVFVDIAAETGTGTGGISNIQHFIGGMDTDTLTGPNTTNTWSITAADAGDINAGAFTFSSFENLTGGPFNDTFDFTSGFTVSGTVNGSTGNNTLLAPDSNNTWNITSNNGGTVAGITFLSIQNLTGNAMDDDFVFANGVEVHGTIDGGAGINTLDYSHYTSLVFVDIEDGLATAVGSFSNIEEFIGGSGINILQGPNVNATWDITGTNQGNINGIFAFTSFENLVGGSGNDTFDFTGGFLVTGTVNGNGGTNTLLAPNSSNTWHITLFNAGEVAGITFTSIDNLTGGSLADDFIFGNQAAVSGAISGGGGLNTLDYSAYTSPVFVDIGSGGATGAGSFNNIQNFIGGASGGNALTGPNTSNTWNFTAQDQGDINAGAFTFASFENLVGGSSNDEFIFNSGLAVNVSGVLNGGGGVNTLNYSAFSSSVEVNIEAGRATSTGGIDNLQDFIGGTGVNTLTGPASTFWVITGLNSGTINGIYSFTSFANLIGGSGDDTFDFTPGFLITGTLDGGPGSNTLLAPNTDNVWHITSKNAGNVSGITFSNIENLTGGSMNDQFVFANQQGVSGVVDGGGLPLGNVLDYTLFTVPAFIVLTSPTSGLASNLGRGFTDIGSIVGNLEVIKIAVVRQAMQTYSTQLSLSYLLAAPLWYDLFNRLQIELDEVITNTNRFWVEVYGKVKERQKKKQK